MFLLPRPRPTPRPACPRCLSPHGTARRTPFRTAHPASRRLRPIKPQGLAVWRAPGIPQGTHTTLDDAQQPANKPSKPLNHRTLFRQHSLRMRNHPKTLIQGSLVFPWLTVQCMLTILRAAAFLQILEPPLEPVLPRAPPLTRLLMPRRPLGLRRTRYAFPRPPTICPLATAEVPGKVPARPQPHHRHRTPGAHASVGPDERIRTPFLHSAPTVTPSTRTPHRRAGH